MASSNTTLPDFVAASGTTRETNYTAPLVVLTSLFFMWGFITCLNDILIPHLKTVFSLNYTQVMLIQFTFFTAYFIVSVPSGFIVEKVGYKRGIAIGLIAAGLGKHTGQGSGILCMAIVGGAIIPVIQGAFADTIGIQWAFFLPILCYLYIAFYGVKGHIPSYKTAAVAS
jgi:fucose permease